MVGSASTLRNDEHWNNLIESAENRGCLYKVNILSYLFPAFSVTGSNRIIHLTINFQIIHFEILYVTYTVYVSFPLSHTSCALSYSLLTEFLNCTQQFPFFLNLKMFFASSTNFFFYKKKKKSCRSPSHMPRFSVRKNWSC